MHSHCTAILCLTEINKHSLFEYIRNKQDVNFFRAFNASAILHLYKIMGVLVFFVLITNVAGRQF